MCYGCCISASKANSTCIGILCNKTEGAYIIVLFCVIMIQSNLKRSIEYCTEQLRQLQKMRFLLWGQLNEKYEALDIDKMANELNEHRFIVQRQCRACHMEYSKVWLGKDDQCVPSNAMQIDSILRQISEDLRTLIYKTKFIVLRPTIEAKAKLQDEHSIQTNKVREMHSTICKLTNKERRHWRKLDFLCVTLGQVKTLSEILFNYDLFEKLKIILSRLANQSKLCRCKSCVAESSEKPTGAGGCYQCQNDHYIHWRDSSNTIVKTIRI